MTISLQSASRQHDHHQQISNSSSFDLKSDGSSSNYSLHQFKDSESRQEEDVLLDLAHQLYKSGNYKQALEHSNTVYERNPLRTDNLLLLGAIYYQDFDMCLVRNEEAVQMEPQFAECFGNMANAWKEKGNVDLAIHYYMIAIEA